MLQRKNRIGVTVAASLAAGAAALAIGAGAASALPAPGTAPGTAPGYPVPNLNPDNIPGLQPLPCWKRINIDTGDLACKAPWQDGYAGILGPYIH